ncbi:unnamed protein product [[Candida] boidinii]|nr:unnamed protein product [[Candida] boidinii]
MQQVPVEDGENVHLPPYGVTHSHHSHYYAHQEDVGTFESHQEIEGVSDDSKKQRRTKRACDLCNRKRTKCDGAFPTCNKCSRSNSACSYLRQKKRRGRASEKYPKIIIRRKPTKRQRVSDNLNIIPCGNNNSNYESANSVSPSSVSMDLNPSCDADPASTMNLSGFSKIADKSLSAGVTSSKRYIHGDGNSNSPPLISGNQQISRIAIDPEILNKSNESQRQLSM